MSVEPVHQPCVDHAPRFGIGKLGVYHGGSASRGEVKRTLEFLKLNVSSGGSQNRPAGGS
jgi:hypothetical protein